MWAAASQISRPAGTDTPPDPDCSPATTPRLGRPGEPAGPHPTPRRPCPDLSLSPWRRRCPFDFQANYRNVVSPREGRPCGPADVACKRTSLAGWAGLYEKNTRRRKPIKFGTKTREGTKVFVVSVSDAQHTKVKHNSRHHLWTSDKKVYPWNFIYAKNSPLSCSSRIINVTKSERSEACLLIYF